MRAFVDHLGRPFQGSDKEYERVLGWSKHPNVIMKISAVPDRKAPVIKSAASNKN